MSQNELGLKTPSCVGKFNGKMSVVGDIDSNRQCKIHVTVKNVCYSLTSCFWATSLNIHARAEIKRQFLDHLKTALNLN